MSSFMTLLWYGLIVILQCYLGTCSAPQMSTHLEINTCNNSCLKGWKEEIMDA